MSDNKSDEKYLYPTHILIDDREFRSGVIKALEKYQGVFFEKKRLETGDYLINDQICIERKTIHDFLESIKSGHLFHQIFQMAGSRYRCILLLEGKNQDFQRSQMKRKAVQGAMLMIGIRFGIPILRSMDAEESAWLIYSAAQQSVSSKREFRLVKSRSKRTRPEPVNCLCVISGIGPNKANQLFQAFDNLSALSNADRDTLISLPGIGEKTAAHIHSIFHQKYSP